MDDPNVVSFKVNLTRGKSGRVRLRAAAASPPPPPPGAGRVPRVARLMALAIRFDRLVRSGEVADYAEIARLGHITRARVSQIINLLSLAPDIQEEVLFLPRVVEGRDPVTERHLRKVAMEPDWAKQRSVWGVLTSRAQSTP